MKAINRIWKLTGMALSILIGISACRGKAGKADLDEFSRHQLIKWNRALTQVMITDVLTPPVCSRAYAYPNIAAYEALVPAYAGKTSFANKLNGYNGLQLPRPDKDSISFSIGSIIAFSTVAQKMVFNSEAVLDLEADYLQALDSIGVDQDLKQRSVNYGRAVGTSVLLWASKDGYLERNSHPAYIVTKEPGRWIPTPPDYMDAIEPNWHRLRPFILDSASLFRPPAPVAFDSSAGSPFMKQTLEVYNAVKNQQSTEKEMALFWDCNPNISVTQGHVMYFQQKISPGGHWMHIATATCQREDYPEIQTAEILSALAITIADGFISCWEAKYHYNKIRPETVINHYIDRDWRPLLQTPYFPEYPSGHSVVSSAAAAVLTKLVKENYAYTDSTEVDFGLKPRQFSSFVAAANEASISRLYGGIHFRDAIVNGQEEGRKIAAMALQKLFP